MRNSTADYCRQPEICYLYLDYLFNQNIFSAKTLYDKSTSHGELAQLLMAMGCIQFMLNVSDSVLNVSDSCEYTVGSTLETKA